MNKKILLSVATVALLSSASNAADDVKSMFAEGKVSGQIRAFSISRSIEDTRAGKVDYTRKATAIGGKLKYETAELNGFTLGTAFYTTNGFALKDNKATNIEVDPTLLGKGNDSYSILGEAYVQYKASNTTVKVGRQKLDTPLAGSDDARMLPNLFQAYLLINTDIADTTLIAGHVTHFAQGTFGRAYGAGGLLGGTSGYSAVDASNQVGDFVNMGKYAVGTNTDGVTVVSATYTGIENLKLQAWDYYAHDILNAIYLQADYKFNVDSDFKPYVAAQYIKESDIGDKLLKNLGGSGEISSSYFALKAGAKIENLSAYVAYSQSSNNSATDAVYSNATISPWGGMPAFTQGMVTRHMFLAGTDATKVAVTYDWKDFDLNLKTSAYWADFDMSTNNGYTSADASEMGFDIIYYPSQVENLQLRLRANYADDFYTAAANAGTVSWDEYRFIVNYNF